MESLRSLVPIAILVVSIGASMPLRNDPSPCARLDERTSDLLDDYRWTDTTTDTATISWRESVSLPRVPVNQIELVNESSICRRAVAFYNSVLADSGDTRQSTSATVIRWGSIRYAVSDTIHSAGEWTLEIVTDTSFTHVFGLSRR